MVVIWSKQAQEELKKVFKKISLDSLQNAEKVRDTIIDLTLALPLHPKSFLSISTKPIMMDLGEPSKSIIYAFHTG
ncbi:MULTISPECIES: type II toxin-antitoxin system RelE/ParE family toxin [Olivibacter]|jgi:hypothetical protein|uniref:Type II toxin-antitoxin system RelE/ParE family toxin n=2 Tax=Olivibacter TaxID=376469 RepID=A0ABV6HRC3_9SPHI